jgi:hypothetical protein
MIKNNNTYRLILIALATIYITSCTELFTNPGSSTPKLSITVTSPVSNDTIAYTGANITYSINKDQGINFIELLVNGIFVNNYSANADGSQPAISITLDPTYIGKMISFYLIYSDKDGTSTQCDSMTNILVVYKLPTAASSKISITASNPVSNDTIAYNGAPITYSINKDQGINFIELLVNGIFVNNYSANSDGSQPAISITLDPTYIGKRISYYLLYSDKDGFSTRCDSMTNILVEDINRIPYTPYNFSFTTISSNIINLSWSDSTKTSSPGYEIWRRRGFYGQYTSYLVANSGTYNINDPDAADTTVYYYEIRGENPSGSSGFSTIINTYGAGATHSIAPPTNLQATAPAANLVVLTWTDDLGGKENYYKIERRYSFSTYTDIGTAVAGATQFVDYGNGLIASTGYYYRVKAIAGNDSSWSNEVYIQTP